MLTAAASELDPEVEAVEAVTAMFPITVPVPNELIAICVPFLGGLPILLPVFENLVLPVTAAPSSGDLELLLPLAVPILIGLRLELALPVSILELLPVLSALPVLGET